MSEENDPRVSVKDAMENIESVRESIRATKGEKYLGLVEIMVQIVKRRELIGGIILPIFRASGVPREIADLFAHLTASLDAKTVSIALSISGVDVPDEGAAARELLDWGERLCRIETDSITSTMPPELKEFLKKK